MKGGGRSCCVTTPIHPCSLHARTLGPVAPVGDWGSVAGAALRQNAKRVFLVLVVGTIVEERDLSQAGL